MNRIVFFSLFPFLFIPSCYRENPCKQKATLEALIEGTEGKPEEKLFLNYRELDGPSDAIDRTDKSNLVLPLLGRIHFEDVTDKEEKEKLSHTPIVAEAFLRKDVSAFHLYPDFTHAAFFATQGGGLTDYYKYVDYKRVTKEDGKLIYETIKTAFGPKEEQKPSIS